MAPFSLLHLTAFPVNKQAQAPARARHLSLPILLAWSCPSLSVITGRLEAWDFAWCTWVRPR